MPACGCQARQGRVDDVLPQAPVELVALEGREGEQHAGAVVGAAQWLALRQFVPWLWIAATSVGMGVGLAVGAAAVDYGVDRGDLMLMGAVTGLGVGALQALVLARQGFGGAVWWAVANPPTWAVAWLISSYVISANIDERFTNFGASGTLLYALVTALLLAWLFRQRESQAPGS